MVVFRKEDRMERNYIELDEWLSSLERCVERLLQFKERGELVKYQFNGHWLYSDTVTMDSAYLEITGKNKNDFDKAQKEWREKLRIESELAEKAARENIPNWIEKGHKAFAEDKWEEWDKIVPIRAEDLYHGMELDNTLQIQEILSSEYSEESFEKAKKCMEEQGHSGMSWSLVRAMIREFCTNGKEFVMWLNKKEKE